MSPDSSTTSRPRSLCCMPSLNIMLFYPLFYASWGGGGEYNILSLMEITHAVSTGATPTGSVHKSRGGRDVCMCVQLNCCCVVCVSVLQRGQYGDIYVGNGLCCC